MKQIAILIPAAGASSRMGGQDKLLLDTGTGPLLARVAARALGTGLPVFVSLPAHDHPRAKALKGLDLSIVAVPDCHLGMSASLRAGIAALPAGTCGAMILPADMPELTTADLDTIAAAARDAPRAILRATSASGTPGHPVVFPADLFDELRTLSGDRGASPVLGAHKNRLRLVPLPETHALCDLDTPQDWADWRARTPSRNP